MKIRSIKVRAVAAPMKRPLTTSVGSVTLAALLLIDLETDQDIVGRSYLFALGRHNLAPLAKLVEAMAEMVKGDELTPFDLERKLRARYALLGVHNIVLFAISGIDMAAWDALGQALKQPLARLLGAKPRPIPAYNSKGLGLLPEKELLKEAAELVGEGFRAVKLRMGRPEAKQDLQMLRAVKKEIGADVTLMVDFNQGLSVAEAIRRGRMIDDEGGVYWIEEPVRADDFSGCRDVKQAVHTPIQLGENFMGPEQMAQALAAGACDYVMPDAERIGGVTGWMRAAALAQGAGVEMSSHLFPEVSCHLLCATPTCHWLEYVDWAEAVLERPVELKDGHVIVPDTPGAGIRWNEKAVERYLVMFTRHFPHWPPGQPKTLELPRETVYANLVATAARHPQRTVIDYYGGRISYTRMREEVDALAGYLQQRLGVARGDRVLLYAQNCPQFVIAYYAILRADAVVVPVNPMNRTEELRHYVEDSDARVAIAGNDVLRELEPLGLKHVLPIVYSDYLGPPGALPVPDFVRAPGPGAWKQALQENLAPGPHLAGPDDLAVMPYTSGTTGKPKGCMHTHASVQATTVAYLYWRGAQDESVVLSALPMFHVTGMQAGMNAPIHTAATLVVLSRWDRDCAAMQIERARVTNWSAITTMLVDFLSNPKLKDYDLSSLRVLGGGGAAMPEAFAKRLEEVIGLPYVEGYGLSETMAPTHINPPHRPKRQCGGIPFYNTDARVLDIQDFHELPPHGVGEIVVHGPQVFQGYWKQPEASAQAFLQHDGKRFFRTGDLGYYDEEGYFFITDRLKRMINCSGYKVWPAEVEAMLYAHPAIQEACVIGARDAYRGETVKALVVLKSAARDTSSKDIIDWAREKMAAFKVPRVVEFVEELPKTATGKILWRKLQEEEYRK